MELPNIPELKVQWEKLNAEYDAYIQTFLDKPKKGFTEHEIEKVKKMQEDLYIVETALFTLIEKEISETAKNPSEESL